VTLACLEAAIGQGRVGREESIVLLVTGNGLKDVGAATKASGVRPVRIAPTMEELRKVIDSTTEQG
jgi:threonine synthase